MGFIFLRAVLSLNSKELFAQAPLSVMEEQTSFVF